MESALALVSPGITIEDKLVGIVQNIPWLEGIVFRRAIISRESGIEDINQLLITNIISINKLSMVARQIEATTRK